MSLLDCRCRLRYPSGFHVDCAFATEACLTTLLGPSGSGKTSVLNMIAGLRRPDDGHIQLGKRVLFDHATGICLAPEHRRIGYVFQNRLLFPHLTVRRNLLYGQQRQPPDARVIDFNRAVQILELDGLLERLPHTLSGGERQRVALGRALLCGPELLLLDEPLAALDVPLKERILDCVEEVSKEWRVPTIYVTHDIGEASRLWEYLVIIEKGQVIHAGATNASMK